MQDASVAWVPYTKCSKTQFLHRCTALYPFSFGGSVSGPHVDSFCFWVSAKTLPLVVEWDGHVSHQDFFVVLLLRETTGWNGKSWKKNLSMWSEALARLVGGPKGQLEEREGQVGPVREQRNKASGYRTSWRGRLEIGSKETGCCDHRNCMKKQDFIKAIPDAHIRFLLLEKLQDGG